jgi:ubiquinol-cytochrome c reductase cytochrome b subunit
MSTRVVAKTPAGKGANFADERVGLSKFAKNNLGKVFPDHWSFMLGEIALYSFLIVLISGVYLTLFFKPSLVEVVYDGSYVPLKGVLMSEAYASTLEISFDVRGGLLMRQIHHWAALFFIAAMSLHMLRVFFTGAFRKPREINWVIGVVLLTLGILAGFTGYSLPDDLLSGTGLRIAHAIVLGIPLIGTYVAMGLFGGEFPGTDFLARVYSVHILLIPGLILAAVTVHLMLVWYQKHTQYPGPGRTENNVVGYRLFPVYTAKAGGFFFIVFGLTILFAGLVTINPVWLYGPYTPDQVTAGSQPDWYIGWLDGAVRLMPAWEYILPGGYTLSLNILIPTLIIPGIMFTLLGLYPWIEQWVTGDRREHNLLDRPRNTPTRTAIGTASVFFYLVLLIAGGNDLIATTFGLSINVLIWVLRILAIAGPPLVFVMTKRICLSLQARDREKLLHGHETGRILRLPHGEFIEIHHPLSLEEKAVILGKVDRAPLSIETGEDVNGVRAPKAGFKRLRAKISHWYYKDNVALPTREELLEAESHLGHMGELESTATAQHRSMEAIGGVLVAPNEDGSSRH